MVIRMCFVIHDQKFALPSTVNKLVVKIYRLHFISQRDEAFTKVFPKTLTNWVACCLKICSQQFCG